MESKTYSAKPLNKVKITEDARLVKQLCTPRYASARTLLLSVEPHLYSFEASSALSRVCLSKISHESASAKHYMTQWEMSTSDNWQIHVWPQKKKKAEMECWLPYCYIDGIHLNYLLSDCRLLFNLRPRRVHTMKQNWIEMTREKWRNHRVRV